MKNCTDIGQSQRLAKILSPDTADMTYIPMMDIDTFKNGGFLDIPQPYPFIEIKSNKENHLPCWTLAALLDLIPYGRLDKQMAGSYVLYGVDSFINGNHIRLVYFDNAVDACVAMIKRLYKDNLL